MLVLWCILSLLALVSSLPTVLDDSHNLGTELEYDSAINDLYYGISNQSDHSKGTVWFDTSSYELALGGFPFIGLYGVTTDSSYSFLEHLSQLGEIAIDKGYHGDFVYIMYRFLYHESLKDSKDVNLLLLTEMVRSLNLEFNKKNGSESLLKILSETSSVDDLKVLYEQAGYPSMAFGCDEYLVIAAQKVYSGNDNYIN